MAEVEIPVHLRVHLTHACLQALADASGLDLLHIKGPAAHPSLRRVPTPGAAAELRRSTDADVLVRPAHVEQLMHHLTANGWQVASRFETGSAFEHAASLWHRYLGWCDVHRRFPGIRADPERAFDLLWADRLPFVIAGRVCQVPSVAAQRTLLLLHAGRSGGAGNPDVLTNWTNLAAPDRAAVLAQVSALDAEVAFAAGTGTLERHRSDPEYLLWEGFSGGSHSRGGEWLGRIRSASSPLAALRLVGRAFVVNTDHLAMRLGHQPTSREVVAEFFARFRRAGAETLTWARRRRHR